eukprot:TRINITY_DN1061_c0_g1_i2.p1 TRINITY_DN1061_c0_g1~~TRINITY_DN1061_c0_g1_i2.p1  ORF type:complete len:227 (+),score=74.80 TRINITY_DN1061_c0_g1_i2:98-682(+)
MLRSLVGSEMCIRDRYQRRVRGLRASLHADHSMIVGIGVIGRHNHPLFIKSWGNDNLDPLKFHRIIHRALDYIEERTNYPPTDQKLSKMYIGLLYPTEDYKTYGYMTQTGTKLVLVLTDTSANDGNINHFFKRFHDCLLYTSDAADEEDSVDLGGRRIIKKKKKNKQYSDNNIVTSKRVMDIVKNVNIQSMSVS